MTQAQSIEFRLPDLGEGMEEAEVVEWKVSEGDEIELDATFVAIQTDKVVIEIPSPFAGRIAQIHHLVGAMVPVGSVLATFEVAGGQQGAPPAEAMTEDRPIGAVLAVPQQRETAHGGPPLDQRPKASPAVRRLAQQLDIDLMTVNGTGPGGRVVAEDLHAAHVGQADAGAEPEADRARETISTPAVPSPAPPLFGEPRADQHITLKGMSLRTAEVMAESWSTVAHTWSLDELDATDLLAAARKVRARQADGDPPITMMAFFVMAVAQALRVHPMQNATLDMGRKELVIRGRVNIRFAVASPSGMRVPVIKDADRLSLHGIASELFRLIGAARDGTLDRADMQDGTFTITNYGALGSRFALPLVRPPEVGIIGFGEIKLRPWIVDGEVVARPVLPVTSCIDHRILGGDESIAGGLPPGGFRTTVMQRLEDPINLLAGA